MKINNQNKIEKLVYDSIIQLNQHSYQSEVISPYIKVINQNLAEILRHLNETENELSIPRKHSTERHFIRSDEKSALIQIAYAMSRFDFGIINDILDKSFNQKQAFQYLSEKLKIKPATLRIYRDNFDPYVDQVNSNRKGWYQKPLSDEFQAIKDEYDLLDYESIKSEIESILST